GPMAVENIEGMGPYGERYAQLLRRPGEKRRTDDVVGVQPVGREVADQLVDAERLGVVEQRVGLVPLVGDVRLVERDDADLMMADDPLELDLHVGLRDQRVFLNDVENAHPRPLPTQRCRIAPPQAAGTVARSGPDRRPESAPRARSRQPLPGVLPPQIAGWDAYWGIKQR